MRQIIQAALCLLAAFSPAWTFAQDSPAASQQRALLGQPRPDFTLADLDNRRHAVSEWNGKVLVINFWATWCIPCKTEIPMLNRLQAEYGPAGVQFIGVAVDTAEAIRQFTKTVPIQYPVLVGGLESTSIVEQYGNVTGTLPYTVFVDQKGRIATIANGALTPEFTRKVLNKMLMARTLR